MAASWYWRKGRKEIWEQMHGNEALNCRRAVSLLCMATALMKPQGCARAMKRGQGINTRHLFNKCVCVCVCVRACVRACVCVVCVCVWFNVPFQIFSREILVVFLRESLPRKPCYPHHSTTFDIIHTHIYLFICEVEGRATLFFPAVVSFHPNDKVYGLIYYCPQR